MAPMLAGLLALLLIAAASCSRTETPAAGPILAVVTVPPLVGLIKPLLPPDASIMALMATGKSEHGYEFTPADIAALGQADIVVYVGLGLEPTVESFLKKNPKAARQEVCFATVAGIKGDDHDHADPNHDHDHDHSHAVDPHLWLDPDLCFKLVDAASQSVRTVCAKTGRVWNPETPAADLKARIKALDDESRTRLAPVEGRAIVTHHNAWQRLADRYGLKVAAVIRGIEGEPSPGAIAAAVEAIRNQNATAVFVEPQFDPQIARRIAEQAGAKLSVLDPLGDGDYFKMMRANVDALASSLGE